MITREMLGQKLIFGFHGTSLSPEIKALIREYKIGNVILFLRNAESGDQLRTLTREIQTLIQAETGHPAFIVIDQEGGMVSRLSADGVNVPCAMALAATGDPAAVTTAGEITIRQLQGLGVNFNMAPVLDVNNNPANPVIGIRSFGDNPETVARLGEAAIAPYPGSGVLCCGKHFPGHGDTAVDSHLGLPRVEKTEQELEKLELIPFHRCIRAGIDAIMISHVMYPAIEPDGVPCTMSRRIVTGLLREKLGFRGLVLTDCMEMGAIQEHFGTPAGVVAAAKAGIDLIELSGDPALQRASAQALLEAAENGELDEKEIEDSVARILAAKKNIICRPEKEKYGLPADRETAQALAEKAVTLYAGKLPRADEKTFFCGCADYRVSGAANDGGFGGDFPSYFGKAFSAPYAVTGKNPDTAEIAAAVEKASQAETIVLGTCNAHLFPGQIALAKALAETGKPLTVVALRNPYDLPALPDCACKIALFDYAAPAFHALEKAFRGGTVTGKMPVAL